MIKFLSISFFLLLFHSLLSQINNKSEFLGNKLCEFSRTGNTDSVIKYIKAGTDVNYVDKYGITPLLYSIEPNNFEIANILIHNGANPNIFPPNGFSALMNASYLGHYELAHHLVKNKAKVNSKDDLGASALHYACLRGSYYIADMLLYYDADINSQTFDGTTPLMIASYFGDTIMMNILLDKYPLLDLKNNDGFTALDFSTIYQNSHAIELLLSKGAKINTNYKNYTTIALAVFKKNNNILKTLTNHRNDSNYNRQNKRNSINSSLLTNNRSAYKILKIKYSPKKGILINGIMIANDITFNSSDYFYKYKVGLNESKTNITLGFGGTLRFKIKDVLIQKTQNDFFQLKERRYLFDLFLIKKFYLLEFQKFKIGSYLGLELEYGIGNYKGYSEGPPKDMYICPGLGIFISAYNFILSFGYLHTPYDYYDISNNKIAISLGYIVPTFKKPKIKSPIILEYQ